MDIIQEHLAELKEENKEIKGELNRINKAQEILLDALIDIYEIASNSEGAEVYALLAEQAIKGADRV